MTICTTQMERWDHSFADSLTPHSSLTMNVIAGSVNLQSSIHPLELQQVVDLFCYFSQQFSPFLGNTVTVLLVVALCKKNSRISNTDSVWLL